MIYFIKLAPKKTAGIENGTNQKKMLHFICFLNTTIREAELENVPTVNEKGTSEVGSRILRIGTKIKLAPPPHIALIQKAKIVANSRSEIFRIIF